MARALALVLLFFALGCGYTWVGAAGSGGALGRVAIHTPENGSTYPGVEVLVADALRREVLRRPGAELSEDADAADWVVSGRVLPVEIQPASLSPVVLTLEYRLTLSLELQARSTDGRQWTGDARTLSESERFTSSADVEAQRKNRTEALRVLARQLAVRVLDQLGGVGT